MNLNTPAINYLLDLWLNEDLGRGDLTSAALEKDVVSAYWIAKSNGVFCGGDIASKIFATLDSSVKTKLVVKDGEEFQVQDRLLEVSGPASILVAAERTALNIAMHLSGIATKTSSMVKKLEGTGVRLTDTRKTTPGLRLLEKYAVRCGGGINHRFGLDDAAMLKENHLAWGKSIKDSINAVKQSAPWPTKIIVEAETPKQAIEAVINGADGILLDEINPEVLAKLVPELRNYAANRKAKDQSNQIILEASGINPLNLEAYAKTGIDLISSSAPITKSAWVDFSMRFESTN